MLKVTPAEAAEALTEFWSQQVIGAANGNLFKVAKGIGSTTWHKHEDQDETFLVLRGELTVQLRTGNIVLEEGDLLIIPRSVEHCPAAATEVHLLLVGPEVTSTPAGGKPDWTARRTDPAGASATISPSTHDGLASTSDGGSASTSASTAG